VQAWWGTREIGPGQAFRWVIGPLELWIEGHPPEWRVATRDEPDALDRFAMEGPREGLEAPEDARRMRFATASTDQRIALRPRQADRPVVVRTDDALSLPASQTVTFYVSTPIWVELQSGAGQTLTTFPSTRLSDTWFGPSKIEGQLCYASRTSARLRLDQLPLRPGRVRTEIQVRNQGPDPLSIERVQLPAPFLPLFVTPDNVLWTPTVTVLRRGSEPTAEVTIADRPPRVAGPTEPFVPARSRGLPSVVVRALGALLSGA